VSLFVGAKYSEIKYPVVEDVCTLMSCPFTFDEFIEMERTLLTTYDWNLQLPTTVEIISTFLSQGILFQSDQIIIETKGEAPAHKIVPLLSLDSGTLATTVKKARQLCQYIPNLLIYDAELSVSTKPMHLTVAIILEARRKCSLTPIWPEELDLMVFGSKSKISKVE